ncbi:hypothetical protein ACPCTO_37085 [Streptomyces olivoreticuli]
MAPTVRQDMRVNAAVADFEHSAAIHAVCRSYPDRDRRDQPPQGPEVHDGLIESMNTKTRLIIRGGFGFHSADAIIALVMLTLPGRQPQTK